MPTCTFFGHSDCPEIKPLIKSVLVELIEKYDVDIFYVGNQGSFDHQVSNVLKELSKEYPGIKYSVVPAYFPTQKDKFTENEYITIIPEGLEKVSPRYSISWRNKWMIKNSDYIVTYITRRFGGAFRYAELGKKAGQKSN